LAQRIRHGLAAHASASSNHPCAERRLTMLTRRLLILSWLILPMGSAAFADERSWKRQRQVLFDQLRNAGTEREARRVEDAIWRMWMANAPTSATAEAVTEAMKKRERYDWDGALELLDEATASAPDYAEVWNQ